MINYVVLNKSDNSFFCYADSLSSIDTDLHVAVPYDNSKDPENTTDLNSYYVPLASSVTKDDLETEKRTVPNRALTGIFRFLNIGDSRIININSIAEFNSTNKVVRITRVDNTSRPLPSNIGGGINFNSTNLAFEFSDGVNWTQIRNTGTGRLQTSLDGGTTYQDIVTSNSGVINSNITDINTNTFTLSHTGYIYNVNLPSVITLPTNQVGRFFTLYPDASCQVLANAGSTINGSVAANINAGQTAYLHCVSSNLWKLTLGYIESVGGSGGITRSVFNINSNTTLGSATNTDYVYYCNSALTITLPTATNNKNSYLIIQKTNGSVTINTSFSETINDDSGPLVLNKKFTQVMITSDGSNWYF
jgi:hypothetical protein